MTDTASAEDAAARSAWGVGEWLRARARGLGFEAVGITAPGALGEAGARFRDFLDAGRHGDMDWLARRPEWRADPARLWPEARSILMVGQNYGPEDDPLEILEWPEAGAISLYAQGRDYHDVVKQRLKALARELVAAHGGSVKVFCDTAPVLEKPLAEAAGIGWRGKHTNLVSREFGSWLFLGALFTTLELPPDRRQADHCGDCRRCLDVCPTDAFPAPYQLDARRCISYLTIEHAGTIAEEFRRPIGNRIFGCDDCLAVCPWNKFAQQAAEQRLRPRTELTAPRLAALAQLDDAAFRALFSKSPVKRLGRDRFVRNVLIAIANSGQPALAEVAEVLLADPSALVRAMAVWALRCLLDGARFETLRQRHAAGESDGDVRAEWRAG